MSSETAISHPSWDELACHNASHDAFLIPAVLDEHVTAIFIEGVTS